MSRLPLLCVLLITSTATAQTDSGSVERYLRTTVGLTAAQLGEARRGHAVSRILVTENSRDVTVVGIVGVRTTQAAYITRIENVRKAIADRTPKFGIIGDPVTAADLQRVSIDSSEYRDLRSCRPNKCNFKLPASEMSELAQGVDWKSRSAKPEVDSIVRADLLRFITRYRAVGNSAMVRYDDRGAVQSSDAFVALLAQSPFMREYAPALRDYLLSYPSHRPTGATDVIYWSEDRLPRLRPTFSVNHMVVYVSESGTPLVARKQIYANHYFEGAFELLAAFDAPSLAGGPGIYLVSVRRYRFDNLPGGLLNIRGRVRDALSTLVRSDLERERVAAEK